MDGNKIILFCQQNCKGKALVVFGDIECLSEQLHAWNNTAQSIIVVRGDWIAYEHSSQKVEHKAFPPGEYPTLDMKISGLRLSSRPMAPSSATMR